MNCPYCGKEMQKGDFYTSDGLSWYPEGQLGLLKSLFSVKEVFVRKDKKLFTAWLGGNIPAYHCPACRKFIFDGMLNE